MYQTMSFAPAYNGMFNLNQPKKNKKKAPRNAFSFFLDEKIEELKAQGFTIHNKGDGVSYANREWKNLPQELKEKYKRKEKEWKQKNKIKPGKLDCRGERIADHVNPLIIQERNLYEQRKFLKAWYEPGNDISRQEIFIISFQSLFELPTEAGYVPVEMACIKFSLKDGIIDRFHQFINPGEIKLGLRGECKLWRDKTHKIPENFEGVKLETHEICSKLLDFIGNQKDLVLFSKQGQLRKNKFCLQWLAKTAGELNQIRVFNLEELVADLYRNVMDGSPSTSVIEMGMESTYHDSDLGTRCEYHEEIESNFCSLLIAQRCCFHIALKLCKYYDVEVQRGKHIPEVREACYTLHRSEDTDFASTQSPSKPNSVASGWSCASRSRRRAPDYYSAPKQQHHPFQSRDIRNNTKQQETKNKATQEKSNQLGDSVPHSSSNCLDDRSPWSPQASALDHANDWFEEDDFPAISTTSDVSAASFSRRLPMRAAFQRPSSSSSSKSHQNGGGAMSYSKLFS